MEGVTLKTPLGKILIVESDGRVKRLVLNADPKLDLLPTTPFQRQLVDLFERYFDGEPVDFSKIPTTRQAKYSEIYEVLQKEVRYGDIVTYAELAELAGLSRRHARVIGNAMAANQIPIIVPCHRVIRSDGRIGNYSGGVKWKIYLLELEGHKIQSGRILKRT